jgi:hypothetical protein
MIDLPTLPTQKKMNPLVAVSDPNRRDLPNPRRKGFLTACDAPIPVRRPNQQRDLTGPPFTDLIALLQIQD